MLGTVDTRVKSIYLNIELSIIELSINFQISEYWVFNLPNSELNLKSTELKYSIFLLSRLGKIKDAYYNH